MKNIKDISEVILDSGNYLDKYLSIYGIDDFSVQQDLMLLEVFHYLIDNACWINLSDNCKERLYYTANQISLQNPKIKLNKATNMYYKNYR